MRCSGRCAHKQPKAAGCTALLPPLPSASLWPRRSSSARTASCATGCRRALLALLVLSLCCCCTRRADASCGMANTWQLQGVRPTACFRPLPQLSQLSCCLHTPLFSPPSSPPKQKRVLDVRNIRILVFDEADEMLKARSAAKENAACSPPLGQPLPSPCPAALPHCTALQFPPSRPRSKTRLRTTRCA